MTLPPAHITFGTAVILTLAFIKGLTVTEIRLEFAVAGVAQSAFEVMVQRTCAPLLSVEVE